MTAKHDSANLDLLRSVAVLLVVACHLAINQNLHESLPGFSWEALGRVGVALFFVHTCLVLMLSMERHREGALAFYVRRAMRIYPFAVVVVLYAAGVHAYQGEPFSIERLASNLLLVQNITGERSAIPPLWSLPFEVQMYLLLPAIYLLARGGWMRIAVLWVLSLIPAMNIGLFAFLPCFLPGVLAYTLRHSRKTISPVVLFACIAAVAVVVPLLVAADLQREPLLWVSCLAIGVLIPFTLELQSRPIARAAAVVAKYSYAIYLTHWFAMIPAMQLVPGPYPVKLLAFFVIQFAFARVAYRWIEAPGIALGARWADRLDKSKEVRRSGHRARGRSSDFAG